MTQTVMMTYDKQAIARSVARMLIEKPIRFVQPVALTLTLAGGFKATTLSQHLIRPTTQLSKTFW